MLRNDIRLIRVASTRTDERIGSPFLPHELRDAVGDTTSVSRTPKDEQPIPRFIRLFVYMLQGCIRAKCTIIRR